MFKQLILAFALIFVGGTTSNAQEKTTDNFIVLEFGLGESGIGFEARKEVGLKWGIEFHHIAGCLVSENFVDSIGKLNAQTEKSIAHKYGVDWKKRFEQEVDKEIDKRHETYFSFNTLIDSSIIDFKSIQVIRTIRQNIDQNIKISFYNLEGSSLNLKNSMPIDSLKYQLTNSKYNVIYRGNPYPSIINLNLIDRNCIINFEGLSVDFTEENDSKNIHIQLKVIGREKEAIISFKFENKKRYIFEYPVSNMPLPKIYLGDLSNDRFINISLEEVKIIVKYAPEITSLFQTFTVESFRLENETGILFEGKGDVIKLNDFLDLKPGGNIILICRVKNNFNEISRKMSHTFTVKKH